VQSAKERRPVADPDAVLRSLVRPTRRRNPEPASRYDLVAIGGGTAGLVAAGGAALLGARRRLSALTVPWSTYTSPEVAHVGLYESQAAERGLRVRTWRVALSEVDRAILGGGDEGFVKIHTRPNGRIVGATVVAENAGDLISEITLAMVGGVRLGAISSVIHPYPTQAEAIKMAADRYNLERVTPFVRRLLALWFAWRR
jgi:pyruvate/2-oxoglutarate dehydrogenase complex dihydrolipoamide dehydrogenase (E3) component